MLRRRLLLTLPAAVLPAAARAAGPWQLVTPDESRRSMAGGPLMIPRSISPPDAPAIVVVQPNDPDKPLKAPLTIRVDFKPQPGASIAVQSFQALYGFFNIVRVPMRPWLSAICNVTRCSPGGMLTFSAIRPVGVTVACSRSRLVMSFRFTVV